MTTNASSFLNAPPYFHHIFPDDGRRRPFRFAQTGSGQTQGQLIDPHPYCTRPDGLLCPEQVRRSARISAQRSRTSRCLRWTLMMCHGRTRLLPLFRGLRVAPSTCRLHRCVSACVPGCVRACVPGWLAGRLPGCLASCLSGVLACPSTCKFSPSATVEWIKLTAANGRCIRHTWSAGCSPHGCALCMQGWGVDVNEEALKKYPPVNDPKTGMWSAMQEGGGGSGGPSANPVAAASVSGSGCAPRL